MPHAPACPALVFFPSLHPSMAQAASTIPYLDPGLAEPGDQRFFRPQGLPLDEVVLAGVVREFERLRSEVKDPKDIAMLADASAGHYFASTSFALREELEDQLHPERVQKRQRTAAQLTLCLAYLLEESLAQLVASEDLDARFRDAMAESLGLDDPDAANEVETASLVTALAGASTPTADALAAEFGLPWQRMLSPFWALLPETTGLLATDAAMASTWIDAGLVLGSPSTEELRNLFQGDVPAGTLLLIRETGWRLLGRTRPDPEAPWLDCPRTVVILQP